MHDNYVVWVAPFAENEHSLMWNPLNVDLNKCEIAVSFTTFYFKIRMP